MNRRVFAVTSSGSRVSRAVFLCALFGVLAVFGLSSTVLHAESARDFYKRGESAEARGDYDAAFTDYQKAHNLKPGELSYRTALYRVQTTDSAMHVVKGRKLLAAGNTEGALAEFLRAAEIDPGNEEADQSIAAVRQRSAGISPVAENSIPETTGERAELNSIGSPAQLKPLSKEPLTLHMTEDSKVIYQAIGKAAGVNVLFDPDYRSERIQVDLSNVSLLDALRIVGTISGTFWRPVTSNTIFVAKDTRAKRMELQEEAVQTFYLSNAWQQNDLTDIQTAIRNVLTDVRAYAVASQNAIVIRGTPDELLLAQQLINDLDKPRPEVLVDIAILEVSKNWEKTLGIAWPTSAGVALQSPNSTSSSTTTTSTTGTTGTTSTTSPTLYSLSHLKATDFAVTVGSAQANMLLTDSSTKILQNPQIRALDGQKATLKIGSKIPIATGSYQSGVGSVAGVSPLAETQFQYQDVGVNIEMTPTVHYDRDITLKIKISVTSESGSSTIEGVTEPIISQREADQVIRLRDGQASILGGIQDKQIIESWNGIPGLSSIPILKYLFGSKDHQIQDDELVFLVVPHIVRSQTLNPVNLRMIDTGEGQSIELRHVQAPAPAPAEFPAANSIPGPQSSVGSVPSSSAASAAPQALAQMRQDAQMNGTPPIAAPPAPAQMEPAAASGSPRAAPAPAVAPASKPATPPAPPAGPSFVFTPPSGTAVVGSTVRIPVVLNGGNDVASVPLQIKYDPAKLALLNISGGDLLNRDGQPVALLHRDEGPGNLTIVASRPPGAAGMSGSGVVCVLSFQAKAAGTSVVAITHPGLVSSAQKQLPATGGQISIQVK